MYLSLITMLSVCSYSEDLLNPYGKELRHLSDDVLRTVVTEWENMPIYRRALGVLSARRKRAATARDFLARREEAQKMSASLRTDELADRVKEPLLLD